MSETKTHSLLIAALGGECGGVLRAGSQRLISRAFRAAHFDYGSRASDRRKTLSLDSTEQEGAKTNARACANAAPGEVDVMVASELLEAVRQPPVRSPDRTLLIAPGGLTGTKSRGRRRLDTERMSNVAKNAHSAVPRRFAAAAAKARQQNAGSSVSSPAPARWRSRRGIPFPQSRRSKAFATNRVGSRRI